MPILVYGSYIKVWYTYILSYLECKDNLKFNYLNSKMFSR